MSTPAHPYLDLDRYADTLGDPSKYFVDRQASVPRVVEHATGLSAYIIDNTGRLRTLVDYLAGNVPAAELPLHAPQPHVYTFGPRPEAKAQGIDAQSLPGKLSIGLEVK